MNKRVLWSVLTVIATVLAVVGQPPAASAATPVRIMPLGDSITGSPGCWRALLWNQLRGAGYTDIDFVGTLPAQSCGVSYDGENEGHGGYLATNIANQNLLPGWLSATRPDVVLMHLGTNDVWNNVAPSTILAAYGRLVDQMRASNPAMKVLVAKIIPMNPAGCSDCAQRVVNLNNAIPGWASAKSTAASPITVVDQWSGFSTSADTYDGVHPGASGDRKMADRWFPALRSVLTPGTGGSALLHGFESGTESWTASGVTGGPWPVTEWASQGTGSLKADVALLANRQSFLARVATQNLASRATLRATVRVAGWGNH
ncbi:MAG TPA: SGNH/GDSL hydrolase family protein, partial [Catenuloplanes sp.]